MNLSARLPDGPPADHRLRIVRVPHGYAYRVQVAATKAATTWTHFVGGRTLPCDDTDACEHCKLGLARKFEAYLAAQPEAGGARVVLALPEGAWRQIEALLRDLTNGGMWGHHLEFLRTGGQRGRLEVFDRGPLAEGERRPVGVNTPAVLQRAWFGRC